MESLEGAREVKNPKRVTGHLQGVTLALGEGMLSKTNRGKMACALVRLGRESGTVGQDGPLSRMTWTAFMALNKYELVSILAELPKSIGSL